MAEGKFCRDRREAVTKCSSGPALRSVEECGNMKAKTPVTIPGVEVVVELVMEGS